MAKDLLELDFPKLLKNYIGYDPLFNELEEFSLKAPECNFPPYDIYEKEVQGKVMTFIKFALAGFGKEDLQVKLKDNVLTVSSKAKKEKENVKYLYKGIAQRTFSITKTISKNLEFVDCFMVDGCLYVQFKNKEIKPEPKEEFIEIK